MKRPLSLQESLCEPLAMNTPQMGIAELLIRTASVHDSEAIAAIYAKHVETGTASFDTVARTIVETSRHIAAINARGWPFVVAEINGAVVGYAYATQFRDRPAYASTCENSIYIDADWLGKGIGSALLGRLITEAEQCGFRQMIAVIGGGEPASVALHTRNGFLHAGRMQSVGRKFGRWLDTVYMQLQIGRGNTSPPDSERR